MAGGQGGHTQHDQLVPPVAVQARRIAFSDLKSQQFLGEGSFGTVYAAQWGTDTVAVKVLHDNRHVPLDVLKRGLKEEVSVVPGKGIVFSRCCDCGCYMHSGIYRVAAHKSSSSCVGGVHMLVHMCVHPSIT